MRCVPAHHDVRRVRLRARRSRCPPGVLLPPLDLVLAAALVRRRVVKQQEPEGRDDDLRPGDVVMLPDGAVAAIERIVGRDAYVVEWTKILGRGPWIFPVSELVAVS